jgi:polysaccharide pyruvyl transferase WcaK-like protein
MNIGAIGWWYYDNQGDLAMLDALQKALSPHRIVPLNTDLRPNEDTIARLNKLDFLVLGGGTLIRGMPIPLFRGFRRWRKHLRTPIGVLGLGVSHVDQDSVQDLVALIEQACFFYVRDRTSCELLDHERVQIAPDITFSYPLEWTARPVAETGSPLCGIFLRFSEVLELYVLLVVMMWFPF